MSLLPGREKVKGAGCFQAEISNSTFCITIYAIRLGPEPGVSASEARTTSRVCGFGVRVGDQRPPGRRARVSASLRAHLLTTRRGPSCTAPWARPSAQRCSLSAQTFTDNPLRAVDSGGQDLNAEVPNAEQPRTTRAISE